jgi:hypothetical protein
MLGSIPCCSGLEVSHPVEGQTTPGWVGVTLAPAPEQLYRRKTMLISKTQCLIFTVTSWPGKPWAREAYFADKFCIT